MGSFKNQILPYVEQEISAARLDLRQGNAAAAFSHLERAHILGQGSTSIHTKIHWLMFIWGLRQKNYGECLGQIVRMIGAATKTAFGLVPRGNTGGSNVSPFKVMPIPTDLQIILDTARKNPH